MLDHVQAERWREQQRAVYGSGDTVHLARQQEPLALTLVEAAEIRAGERLVDVGAGTGISPSLLRPPAQWSQP